jgi:hypothetical protein
VAGERHGLPWQREAGTAALFHGLGASTKRRPGVPAALAGLVSGDQETSRHRSGVCTYFDGAGSITHESPEVAVVTHPL